ncbi:MAG TPA: AsmA-like C-terminal region-containing protein [Xanthobacteraceae bacterium]|nr:AsmA-like C-terminal region-containing protein [Xanthobacteraceae bacterium]
MIDRDASADTARRLQRTAVTAIVAATMIVGILATGAATAGTRADAVIAALALGQGRHCVVTRTPDARVTVRGDACDGRRLIRAILTLLASSDAEAAPVDVDLDIVVKTLDGFNHETLRDVTLRLWVEHGAIAAFALAAKLRDGDVSGVLGTAADRRPTIRLDAGDAGAFLRWAGLYRHMRGGTLNIAVHGPAADGAAEDGVASLRAFTIVDDPALRPLARLLFDRRSPARRLFAFSRLRLTFNSRAGHVAFGEGMIIGEPIEATLDGSYDLAQDRLDLRGVMVPLVQFSQAVPMDLPNEVGLIASDYAISGPPSAPVLRIDPLRTLAPGFMRKLFEFASRAQSLEP